MENYIASQALLKDNGEWENYCILHACELDSRNIRWAGQRSSGDIVMFLGLYCMTRLN